MSDSETGRQSRSTVDRTRASRSESSSGLVISPLQGTKIVIQNLQSSVTQEDIRELFGDIGTLKQAKLVSPDHAEVTLVNKSDTTRAVEIYHNRQLDERPMKCQMVGDATKRDPQTTRVPRLFHGRNAYTTLKAVTNRLARTRRTSTFSI